MSDVKLGLDATLKIDGVEIENVKDLALSLSKAEADATTRKNNGWRALVGTLKEAEITFTVLNIDGDTAFALFYDAWLAGTPLEVEISDVGAALVLDCEVMGFDVNQALEEVIGADVTLKPTVVDGGEGINNDGPPAPP
jgi:hypothetical protein